jgi:hypothetical protein
MDPIQEAPPIKAISQQFIGKKHKQTTFPKLKSWVFSANTMSQLFLNIHRAVMPENSGSYSARRTLFIELVSKG